MSFLGRLWQRLPLSVRDVALSVRTWLPGGVLEHLAVRVLGMKRVPVTAVEVPAGRVRLLIAPANFAGQGYEWARAVERELGVGAANLGIVRGGSFGFVSHEVVTEFYEWSKRWQRAERAAALGFTHLLVEAERAPFPLLDRGSFLRQLRQLRRAGLQIGTLCHGSDIRLPSRNAQDNPWSPFRDRSWEQGRVLEQVARRNVRWLERLREQGVPAFVSTPDLLTDVPWAAWCPVVVDVDRWAADTVPFRREVPTVVHAPSSNLKGSNYIEPILHELASAGRIRYTPARGLSREEMVALYHGADIVIDQFSLGIYGAAACEALAAGRVTVSYVAESTRNTVREQTGHELPIVQADPTTLRDVIVGLCEDPDEGRRIARQGPGFVRDVHDGRRSALALARLLGNDAD